MHKISQYIYDICKTHIEFYDIKYLSWSTIDTTIPAWISNVQKPLYKIGFAAIAMGTSYSFKIDLVTEQPISIEKYVFRAMYEIEQKYGIKSSVSKEEMIKSVGSDDPFKLFLEQT
jgi:hypothetical protein